MLHEKMLEAARVEVLQKTLVQVEEQKQKAEAMLLNILPASVARDLQQEGVVQPMYFEDVTVCFTDFVGFSRSTALMAAEEVVEELNRYFTAFDQIVERYGLEKLKTIGDSYMFVSGLPTRRSANPIDAVLAALEIVEAVRCLGSSNPKRDWKIRVGLHTGPVIAGVVGIRKFAFDIWGETVNLASRMESCGEPNRVNISDRTFARVKDFVAGEPRGRIKTKEGQDIEMYFVQGVLEQLLTECSECPPPLFERRYKLYFRDNSPSFPEHLRLRSS
jgi:class 3 adenylate cyclase